MINASPFWHAAHPLILASGSAARRALLDAAGIPVEICKPDVDEVAIAADLRAKGTSPKEMALALAHAKAGKVARRHPDRLLLAADQTLDDQGRLMMKAEHPAQARAQLEGLSGRSHRLHSAAVLRRGDAVLWAGVETATLHMRTLPPAFLDAYCAAMGETICETVGGYQLEALGIHLFARIEGDHATILGLPMLGVLQALRMAECLQN